jgi:hypothetical protein
MGIDARDPRKRQRYARRASPILLRVTTAALHVTLHAPSIMNKVWEFDVKLALFCSPGAAGPVGIPLSCRKAKLRGSSQFALQTAKL